MGLFDEVAGLSVEAAGLSFEAADLSPVFSLLTFAEESVVGFAGAADLLPLSVDIPALMGEPPLPTDATTPDIAFTLALNV